MDIKSKQVSTEFKNYMWIIMVLWGIGTVANIVNMFRGVSSLCIWGIINSIVSFATIMGAYHLSIAKKVESISIFAVSFL